MTNYDSWLERSYQRRCAEDDAFMEFCDEYDIDPNDDDSLDQWEDYKEAMSEPDPDDLRDQMLDREWDYDD